MKTDYKLLDEKIFNLGETVMNVRVNDIDKILNWLNDNQMLSFSGKKFSDHHYRFYKRLGKL